MQGTHYLLPQKVKICLNEGELYLKMDGQKIKLAAPKRAMPLSSPDEYIILFDESGTEIGVLKSLHGLDSVSHERLSQRLEEIYRAIPVLKILEVEREPLSGQVRWRVEIEADEAEEPIDIEVPSSPFRLLRRSKAEGDDVEIEAPRREVTFLIAGAEDVQTARYPRIFLSDVEGNRYEIPDCESLDLASRRMAERFF
ncbi:DUF1854 domain-containing protein [bacterium]|nr:MAG: DUF1854 domain-containing protein [bacterium]